MRGRAWRGVVRHLAVVHSVVRSLMSPVCLVPKCPACRGRAHQLPRHAQHLGQGVPLKSAGPTCPLLAPCTQGPCVLFATPGMLTGGVSLEVFKQWAPDPKNLVVLPGYQVWVVQASCQ